VVALLAGWVGLAGIGDLIKMGRREMDMGQAAVGQIKQRLI
jgi:hypothetical protein